MTLLKFTNAVAERELHEMLGVRRRAYSKTEKRFIATYIDTLPGVTVDGYGNRRVTVGGAHAPPILWSCHTDSVHSHGGMQSIIRDGDMIRLHKSETQSNCLGADDGAGVWLMRQMILRGVPGHYIFHRDEESGGQGSNWVLFNDSEWLSQFQCAIALDRKGYHSVITHQGSRCASDAFARSLAFQLGGQFEPDSTGVFTDTANYTDVIPECTNLSVGYGAQHFANEAQNVPFVVNLLDALCAIDAQSLVIERDPKDIEVYDYTTRWTDHYDWRGGYEQSSRSGFDSIYDLVCEDPHAVADFLEMMGVTADDIKRGNY